MFTRKSRRNYRIAVWSAVVVCLCILIIYFAWPENPEEPDPFAQNPDYEPSSSANTDEISAVDSVDKYLEEDDEYESSDETVSENDENSEVTVINESASPYYLVKRVGNEVVVFFCDSNGNMVMLETTEILYEMLGPEDQKLFDQGIQIDSQEKLSVLLQDFEG